MTPQKFLPLAAILSFEMQKKIKNEILELNLNRLEFKALWYLVPTNTFLLTVKCCPRAIYKHLLSKELKQQSTDKH